MFDRELYGKQNTGVGGKRAESKTTILRVAHRGYYCPSQYTGVEQ